MLFEDIPGQDKAKESLKHMMQEGRLPHALLFLGPRGSGKLALALATAKYLLCSRRGEGEACGDPHPADGSEANVCANCRKSSRFIHPDLHFSFPTVGSKASSDTFMDQWRTAMEENPWLDLNDWLQAIDAENKQGNITREECQQIIRKLSFKPFEAAYKVLIMWMPELLGKEGNRLLKLIEEPPDQTIFILVAEDQERILPTLLSRCQLVNLGPLRDEEVQEGLEKRFPGIGPKAESISFQAHGRFDDALRLAVEREDDNSSLFFAWLRLCFVGNGVELVAWTDEFSRFGRENQKYFLMYALHFLREFTMLKVVGPEQARLGNQERETAIKLSPLIDLDQAGALAELFNECIQAVERNANPKILFLNASIRVHRIMKKQIATVG